MELHGTRQIAAGRQTVWDALNDPAILKDCIPGCREMTGNAEDGFTVVATQKIGPVKATFRGKVKLGDIVEGRSYRISGEGKGGAAGFAKGGADVTLEDADGGTRLVYRVDAKVGGKLASIGGRVIDGVARKLADQFFENFQNKVAPVPEEAGAGPEPEEPEGWLARVLAWLRRLFG
ncbi:MAG: CoxG family protein [Paracoccaceae bacterium]